MEVYPTDEEPDENPAHTGAPVSYTADTFAAFRAFIQGRAQADGWKQNRERARAEGPPLRDGGDMYPDWLPEAYRGAEAVRNMPHYIDAYAEHWPRRAPNAIAAAAEEVYERHADAIAARAAPLAAQRRDKPLTQDVLAARDLRADWLLWARIRTLAMRSLPPDEHELRALAAAQPVALDKGKWEEARALEAAQELAADVRAHYAVFPELRPEETPEDAVRQHALMSALAVVLSEYQQ